MMGKFFNWFKAFNKGLVIGTELVAALAVVMVGVGGYILYELSRGPIDLEFARGYIEDALSSEGENVQIQFKQAEIVWPELSGPLSLQLKGLQVWQEGRPLMEVHDIAINLAKAPLLIGRIRPERIILNRPTIMLERSQDNRLSFALAGPLQTQGQSSNMARLMLDILLGSERGKDYGFFARVKEVEIKRARLRIADQLQGMTWQLNNVTVVLQKVDVGVYGSVSVLLPNSQQFSLWMTYHRGRDELTVNARIKDFNLSSIAGRIIGWDWLRRQRLPMSGSFSMAMDVSDFRVYELQVQASGERGALDLSGHLSDVVPIEDIFADISYRGAEHAWRFNPFSFRAHDIPVRVVGGMQRGPSGEDFSGSIHLLLDEFKLADLDKFWPLDARDKPLARWMLQKLSQATLKNVDIDVPIRTHQEDHRLQLSALIPKATFEFENLKADYRPPLYPIENAVGKGSFENDRLDIKVSKGKMADLTVGETSVVIDDVSKKGAGVAHVKTKLAGPLPTVLRYIGLDPINKGDEFPLKPAQVKGKGDFEVNLQFPTLANLPIEDIKAEISAVLDDLSLPGLAMGQTLSGGPFALEVKDESVSLRGSGRLAGNPLTLDFLQTSAGEGRKASRTVKADLVADAKLRAAFGVDLQEIEGNLPLSLDYADAMDGHEKIAVKADLTPALLHLIALGYQKPAGEKGSLDLSVQIKDGVPVKAEGVNLIAPKLKATGGTLAFGKINKEISIIRADFKTFNLGDSQMSLSFDRKPGLKIVKLTGRKLDLKPFANANDGQAAGSRLVFEARADELTMGGLENAKNCNLSLHLGTNAEIDTLQISGVAGSGPFDVRYLPDSKGRMTLNIRAQNAGSFLRAMDVYENMVGGRLELVGGPTGDNKRDVKGDLSVYDFRIVKAPILARLLGSMSAEGLDEQLRNVGIGFERLQADFAWLQRPPEIDVMTFRDGKTKGSALGLTFEGQYDRKRKEIDLEGTIVPLAGLNNFASKIPLLGRIITGGSDSALFAATYSLKGPADDPRTMINPLSVFTPGILRRLLFEGSPDDPLKQKNNSRTQHRIVPKNN